MNHCHQPATLRQDPDTSGLSNLERDLDAALADIGEGTQDVVARGLADLQVCWGKISSAKVV